MPFDAKPLFVAAEPRPTCGPALTLERVSLIRGGQPLLDDVTVALQDARRTVVMGPNGAGKSTLLRVLKGLLPPDRGAARLGDRPLDAEAAKRIGLVLQRPVLLRRSARANLIHALRAYGAPRTERAGRAAELLALAGLAAQADRPARMMSGGEQQRLSIVRALAAGPEILLLDEPTASLDPHATQAIERLIDQAAQAGVKTVLVTHDVGQAQRLADAVLFLHRGRVAEQGAADRFFSAPGSAAARAYLEGRLCL